LRNDENSAENRADKGQIIGRSGEGNGRKSAIQRDAQNLYLSGIVYDFEFEARQNAALLHWNDSRVSGFWGRLRVVGFFMAGLAFERASCAFGARTTELSVSPALSGQGGAVSEGAKECLQKGTEPKTA
jgi:hypothetical protein